MKRSRLKPSRAALIFAVIALLVSGVSAQAATTEFSSDFESGDPGAWHARGPETLSVVADAHSGSKALLVSNRRSTWNAALHALTDKVVIGDTYHVDAWVKFPKGTDQTRIVFSVETGFKDASASHTYKNVLTVQTKKGEWTLVASDYQIPVDSTIATVDFYFESPYKADNQVTDADTLDYLLDDVVVTHLPPAKKIAIQENIPSLGELFAPWFPVGAAIEPEFLDSVNPHYRLLLKQYSALVAGNFMKPDAIQPVEGKFTFAAADKLVAFASSTGKTVRGHTLLWHQQIPSWFFTDPKDASKPATKELLSQRLKTHIQTTVKHFKGDVAAWDVVNEVLSDTKGLRGDSEGSKWLSIMGPDYIDNAFRWAHEADPDAELVINDYNLESDARKRDEMYNLVKGMLARKVPVNAIGMQMHISLYGPSITEIKTAIEKFASLGVKVQITELDVSIYRGNEEKRDLTPALLKEQAQRYSDLFKLFVEEAKKGKLDMVVLWGASDDDTWLDNFPVPGRPNAPLLFDRELQAKPAFDALSKLAGQL